MAKAGSGLVAPVGAADQPQIEIPEALADIDRRLTAEVHQQAAEAVAETQLVAEAATMEIPLASWRAIPSSVRQELYAQRVRGAVVTTATFTEKRPDAVAQVDINRLQGARAADDDGDGLIRELVGDLNPKEYTLMYDPPQLLIFPGDEQPQLTHPGRSVVPNKLIDDHIKKKFSIYPTAREIPKPKVTCPFSIGGVGVRRPCDALVYDEPQLQQHLKLRHADEVEAQKERSERERADADARLREEQLRQAQLQTRLLERQLAVLEKGEQ